MRDRILIGLCAWLAGCVSSEKSGADEDAGIGPVPLLDVAGEAPDVPIVDQPGADATLDVVEMWVDEPDAGPADPDASSLDAAPPDMEPPALQNPPDAAPPLDPRPCVNDEDCPAEGYCEAVLNCPGVCVERTWQIADEIRAAPREAPIALATGQQVRIRTTRPGQAFWFTYQSRGGIETFSVAQPTGDCTDDWFRSDDYGVELFVGPEPEFIRRWITAMGETLPISELWVQGEPLNRWRGETLWMKVTPGSSFRTLGVCVRRRDLEAECLDGGRRCPPGTRCEDWACVPIFCGDGDVEGNETCDDGRENLWCVGCQRVEAAPGEPCRNRDDCDDHSDCRAGLCVISACGDGVVVPSEECEPNGGLACDDCRLVGIRGDLNGVVGPLIEYGMIPARERGVAPVDARFELRLPEPKRVVVRDVATGFVYRSIHGPDGFEVAPHEPGEDSDAPIHLEAGRYIVRVPASPLGPRQIRLEHLEPLAPGDPCSRHECAAGTRCEEADDRVDRCLGPRCGDHVVQGEEECDPPGWYCEDCRYAGPPLESVDDGPVELALDESGAATAHWRLTPEAAEVWFMFEVDRPLGPLAIRAYGGRNDWTFATMTLFTPDGQRMLGLPPEHWAGNYCDGGVGPWGLSPTTQPALLDLPVGVYRVRVTAPMVFPAPSIARLEIGPVGIAGVGEVCGRDVACRHPLRCWWAGGGEQRCEEPR